MTVEERAQPVRAVAGTGRRGRILAAAAVLLGLVLLLHRLIPNTVGNVGSLVETFLPWLGLFVPLLLAGALLRRSAVAAVAAVLPVVVWLGMFGGTVVDKSGPAGDLTFVSHNVGAANPDPAGTARGLAVSGADVVALQELTGSARGTYEDALADTYPFHVVMGTVGLWSRLPLSDTRPVDVALDTTRALRATVATGEGPLVVYVAHLGSVRVFPRNGFWTQSRDAGIAALDRALAADRADRVVLLGDLNGTMDDRAFAGLTDRLQPVQEAAGAGFGFSWPASFPVVRSDQILVHGLTPDRAWVLPATGSDHLPVAATVSLPGRGDPAQPDT
ncbi:teicoplanin resistance protein VanJ [Pseudonocardia sulfidoxydans NBRC 16205]|uniref:Teicoplanin resistance protein VanJ n=1 Tax=Pseudonocardia sulfidoxydans NBRC 16205 TaxID=1223511 RepID=A0A511DCT6_9PSEU|nr:endonuclease/exonuclease/phosphatase family protein [Pseudonocardia sulfidoxydans]GEL22367.1 teicoplanin resistance protein VanJ [Pseudonocardia sulfidoxydans NBRC 16205]